MSRNPHPIHNETPAEDIHFTSSGGDVVKVTFGSFARLYRDTDLHRAINVPGLTIKGFRAFLRCLSVPTLQIGSTYLVDGFSFFLALRAITRIGAPDFLAPGSKTHNKPARLRASKATRLNVEEFRRNWKEVAAELMIASRLNRARISDRALGRLAVTTMDRMLAASLHHAPLRSQRALAARELARLDNEGTLPAWSPFDATPTPPIPDAPPGPGPEGCAAP